MTGGIKLADVRRELKEGAVVRYRWGRDVCLVRPSGNSVQIDGRSYQGFLRSLAPKLARTETGSTGNGDLVIEWRQP